MTLAISNTPTRRENAGCNPLLMPQRCVKGPNAATRPNTWCGGDVHLYGSLISR